MYLLKGSWIDENKLEVEIIYNLDVQENHNISQHDGVVVESYPEVPNSGNGKAYKIIANKNGEITYEEFTVPLTKEELLEQKLIQQQEIIEMLVMDSLGGEKNV